MTLFLKQKTVAGTGTVPNPPDSAHTYVGADPSGPQVLKSKALDGKMATVYNGSAPTSGHGNPWFDVEAYCIGTLDKTAATNMTAAFAAAAAAIKASPRGGDLFIPAGLYLVDTGTIDLSASTNPFKIHGPDRGIALIFPNGTGDVIKFGGSDGCSVQDLGFWSSGATQTAGNAINTNGCDDLLVKNVLFNNQFVDVNVNNNSLKVCMTGCVSTHGVNNGANSVGCLVNNGPAGDTYIGPDWVFSDTAATRRRASIEVIVSGHFEINQVNATGSVQGLIVDPGAGQIAADGFINHSLFDSCTVNGVTLNAATATSIIKSLHFFNSWFAGTITGTGGAGLLTTGTAGGIIDGVEFTSCRALNNQTHGYQHGFGTNFRWQGGRASGNSSAASAASDGINIAAGVSSFCIIGVKSGGTDAAGTGGQQRYGVNIVAGSSNFYTVTNNDFIGNLTGGLFDGGTGFSKIVKDNLPYLMTGGLPVTLGGNFTATAAEVLLAQTTIPANVLQVGTILKFTAHVAATQTAAAVTFIARIRIGPTTLTGTVVALGGAVTPATARTTESFTVQGTIRVTAIGATGAAIGGVDTFGNFMALSTLMATAAILAPPATVNTTVQNFAELTLISAATVTAGQVLSAAIECVKP